MYYIHIYILLRVVWYKNKLISNKGVNRVINFYVSIEYTNYYNILHHISALGQQHTVQYKL